MLFSKLLFSDRNGKRLCCFVEEGGSKDLIVALLKQGGAKICRTLSEVKDHNRQHILVARLQYKADKRVSKWGWIPVDLEWVVKSCTLNCIQELHKYKLGARARYSPVFETNRRKLFDQLLREGLMKISECISGDSQNSEPRVPFATSTQNTSGETANFVPDSEQSQPRDAQQISHQSKFDRSPRDRPPPGRGYVAGEKITSRQGFSMLVNKSETFNNSIIAQAGVSGCGSIMQQPGSSARDLTCTLSSLKRGLSQRAEETPANNARVTVIEEEPENDYLVAASLTKEASTLEIEVQNRVREQLHAKPKTTVTSIEELVSERTATPPTRHYPLEESRLMVDSATSPCFPTVEEEMTFFTRHVPTWKRSKPFRKAEVKFVSNSPFVEDGQVAGGSRDATVPQAVVAVELPVLGESSRQRRRLTGEVVLLSSSEDECQEPVAASRSSPRRTPTNRNATFCPTQQLSSSKQPYTNGLYRWPEKRSILEYIVKKQEYYRVKGNALWEEMEMANVCPKRSHQSMKEHFKKQLLPNISHISFLNDHQKNLFKKYKDYDFRKKGIPLALAPAATRHSLCISPNLLSSSSSSPSPPSRRRREDASTTVRTVPPRQRDTVQASTVQASAVQAAPASSEPSAVAAGAVGIRKLFRQRSFSLVSSPTKERQPQLPTQPVSTLGSEQPASNNAPDSVSAAPVVVSAAPAISVAAARRLEIERCFQEAVAHPSPLRPLKRIMRRPETSDEEDELLLNNTVKGSAPVDATTIIDVTARIETSVGAEITAAVKATGSVEVTKQLQAANPSALESPIKEKEGSQDFVENSPIASSPKTLSAPRKGLQLSARLSKIRRTLRMESIASPIATADNVEIAGAELGIEILPLQDETACLGEGATSSKEVACSSKEDRDLSSPLGRETPPLVPDKYMVGVVLETSDESTDIESEMRPGQKKNHAQMAETLGHKLKEVRSKKALTKKRGPIPKMETTLLKLQEPLLKTKKLHKNAKELANSQCDEATAETANIGMRTRSAKHSVAGLTIPPMRTRAMAASTGSVDCEVPATESAVQIEPAIPKKTAVSTETAFVAGTTEALVNPLAKIRVRSLEELNTSKELLEIHRIERTAVKRELGVNRSGCTSAFDSAADNNEATEVMVDLVSDDEGCAGDLALQEADRLRFVAGIQKMLVKPLIEVIPDTALVIYIKATTPDLTEDRELDAVSVRCPACGWLALHGDVRYHDMRASLAFCPLCPQVGAGGTLLELLFWLELTVTIGGELMKVVAAGPVAEQLFCCSPQEYLFVESSRKLFATKLSTSLRFHGTLLVATAMPPAFKPSEELLRPVLPTVVREHPPSTLSSNLLPHSLLGLPTELYEDNSEVVIFLGRLLV